LAEFLKEGKIDFLQKAESLFEIAKESRYRIVAVVGLFDKGGLMQSKSSVELGR
jgi:esterase/lipase